jgi:DNA polymerase-3 subunit alpha
LSFFHSHLHSEYSVNDAILRIKEAAKRAAEMGQPAMALTDHGTMAGCVEFYQACRSFDVLPILGIEAYMVPDVEEHRALAKEKTDAINKEARENGQRKHATTVAGQAAKMRRHCLLMARDFTGYQMLCRAASRSFQQGYFKPLFQFSDIEELAQGGHVWLTTGCLNGEIPKLIIQGREEHAERRARHYRDLYGERFAIELQHHGIEEDDQVVDYLWDLGQRLSIPVIAAHDVHYLEPDDLEVHNFFKGLAYKKASGAQFNGTTGFHLCGPELLEQQLGATRFAEALRGLDALRADCSGMSFPPLDTYSYEVPEVVEGDALRALLAITQPPLKALVESAPASKREAYRQRYATEMGVIRDTGFAQYFLLVRLIVKFCEDNDIFVIARGSASGSLVCHLLNITQMDPIEHKLLFERFLSNDRSKPPDIDLDVEDHRRDEVLEYVSRRFATTQIGTNLTYADRSARNEIAAQLKRENPALELETDDDALDSERGRLMLSKITGLKRAFGGHPAGVIAETARRPVADLVPMMMISSSDRWVTQYSMDAIESLGFVKVDILGVRSLRTVRRCLELMEKRDWNWIPERDRETIKLIGRGDTDGVFTFQGWSAKKGCKLLKPKNIDDCSLVAAMWRPSCLELGLEQLYLDRRAAKWVPPDSWHPVLASVLKETYGIAVYQEQVIQVMKGLGFSADDVMTMLRAVKKKDATLMAEVRRRIAEKEPDLVEQLWELMEGYTRYGFNRSHSYAYARFGYRMAYLKANHPLEFYCATLETQTAKTDQQLYVRLARKDNIKVLPACIMRSGVTWQIEGTALRRGLTSVGGVGEKAAQAIAAARPFHSLEELRNNVSPTACNVGVLKKLARARALASLGIEDEQALVDAVAELTAQKKKTAKENHGES